MKTIDFNNKTFLLVDNSDHGTVNNDTVFRYQQKNAIITATYDGGSIKYGKILAKQVNTRLEMLYHCVTTQNELKAGKAVADISFSPNNKIILRLQWEWLNNNKEKGTSTYLEQ